MAAVDIGARDVPPVPAADELDDLFDYDVGDVFRNVDTNIDVSTPQKSVTKIEGRENLAGLGIDQEIKVIKKRAPVPKLDENRFLTISLSVVLIANLAQTARSIRYSKTTANCERSSKVQRQRA